MRAHARRAAWRHPRGPCCWPRPTAPLAAGPCVRLLGEESRGGRARRGRKAGELLAEGDEQGGETSRENRRGGERAVQGRGTSRGGEGTHLGGLQASSTGGEEIQAGEEQRRLGGARPREDDQRRRGRSSAGLEEQRRRVKLPFGACLRAGVGSTSGNRPGAR